MDLKWIDLKWIDLKWIDLKWIDLKSYNSIYILSTNLCQQIFSSPLKRGCQMNIELFHNQ